MNAEAYKTIVSLLKLATDKLNQATETLAAATKALKATQEKGQMLRAYRQDYIAKLVSQLEQGMGKESHLNYQNFLDKLEQAINGQDTLTTDAGYQQQQAEKQWQEAQRKKMSYEVLLKRADKKAHATALKRDQKMMDEYAVRAATRSARSRHAG